MTKQQAIKAPLSCGVSYLPLIFDKIDPPPPPPHHLKFAHGIISLHHKITAIQKAFQKIREAEIPESKFTFLPSEV